MTVSVRLSWNAAVTGELSRDGEFRVLGPTARLTFSHLSKAAAFALERLTPPGEAEGVLADTVLAAGGATELSRWYFMLQRLASRGLVVRSVHAAGARLATLVPRAPAFRLGPAVAPGGSVVLSRFAYLRREDSVLVLESPCSHARVVFDDPAVVALLGVLAVPGTPDEHRACLPGLPVGSVAPLIGLLAAAGMVESDGPGAEPPVLRSWEFHDLLFHARSRKGRSDAPFGATYRPEVGSGPPPALRPVDAAQTVELFRPDLVQVEHDDPPLTQVMEARRSLREYGDRAVTARQLGEFLYRVARMKSVREVEIETPHGPVTFDMAARPFPSGGSLYELEFYLAVQACDGLDPGLYRYHPQLHRLAKICDQTADVNHLIHDASSSAAIPEASVQVVVILAARFRRLTWKYSSIAYALILKHVGVVYQTMYLTATAMGLAPCALGGGDSDLFARATGLDYYDESSVGEFLLGSRPAGNA